MNLTRLGSPEQAVEKPAEVGRPPVRVLDAGWIGTVAAGHGDTREVGVAGERRTPHRQSGCPYLHLVDARYRGHDVGPEDAGLGLGQDQALRRAIGTQGTAADRRPMLTGIPYSVRTARIAIVAPGSRLASSMRARRRRFAERVDVDAVARAERVRANEGFAIVVQSP